MTLAEFTERKLLLPRLHGDRQHGAVIELSKRLASTGRIDDADAFASAVMDREALVPTGIDSVAFPHARGQAIKTLSVCLGLSIEGIRWGLSGTGLVHMVVLFAVPLSETQRYLSLLARFAGFIKTENGFSTLFGCAQPEEMFRVLNTVCVEQMSHSLVDANGALR